MKALLVTYTLNDSGKKDAMIKQIKSYSDWAKINDFCWIIVADKSAPEVRNDLRDSIDQEGSVFVINITSQGWGSYALPTAVTDWMKTNLKQE